MNSRHQWEHQDPVCGKKMNRNKAHITIEFEGNKYMLCCPTCQAEFEKTPARYTKRLTAVEAGIDKS